MKKIVALITTLAIMVSTCFSGTFNIYASAYTSGYYTYTVSNGEAIITDCDTSISGSITIPSSLGGYPVTSIGERAFSYCKSLTNITVPNSVTSIGREAFYECICLNIVNIIDIEAWCNIDFYDYYSNPLYYANYLYVNNVLATEIVIPYGITSIGSYVFYHCESLISVSIPNSVISIGHEAFYCCINLTSITIPDSVTSIGNSTFSYCRNLTSITIPNNVKSIGTNAFDNCRSLTNITIGDGVTSIGSKTFNYCTSLTSIKIPNSVTSIGTEAFHNCGSLTSTTIPDSITRIGEYAFYGCTSLEMVNITDIKAWCNINFGNNSSNPLSLAGNLNINNVLATELILPENITRINYYTFCGCTSIKSITIPNSVTSIGDYAFYDCDSLTSITIPDSVTRIGQFVFSGCTNLIDIIIPASVVSIEYEAFYNCTSLTNITIPDSVTNICAYAFYNCESLNRVYYRGTEVQKNNITISSKGNSYLENAYWCYNSCINSSVHTFDDCYDTICNLCGSIRTITHRYEWIIDKQENCGIDGYKHEECTVCYETRNSNTVIPATGNHNYEWVIDKQENCGDGYKHEECTICHQIQNENTVIEATGVHTFASDCDLKCEVCFFERTVSEEHSFKNRYDVECDLCGFIRYLTYEIENDYVTIFKCDVNFIGKMEIPETIEGCAVKYIADNAFEDCKYLTAVKMPDTILEIGDYAFSGCTSLVEVAFSQAIEKIGEYAFSNCITINEIIVPDTVKTVGFAAFGGCKNLSKITLPFVGETIEETENDYFAYIFGAESIINYGSVPKSLSKVIITKAERIEAYAFYNCNYILEITLPSSLKYIGESAFEFCKINGVYISDIENWFGIEFENITSNPIGYSGLLYLNDELYTNHKISRDTLVIEQSEYCNYKCIKNLYIPKSVELIMEGAFLDCNSLGYIFYEGTKEQWDEIVIVTGNDSIESATVFYNCDDIYECYINGHSGGFATCKKKAKCSCCGQEYGNLASHNYKSATCSVPKTCKVCGATSGKTLGHTYTTTTTKATLTKNGKIIKKCTVCGDTKTTIVYYPKTIKFSSTSYTYNGSAKKPTVTVKGYDGKTISSSNYTVTYKNNTNNGTATVTVTFKGNYSGTKKLTFKINPVSTSKATYKLSTSSYTYTGKAKSPTVTVKLSGKTLKKNTDYTVKYSNNKSVGKATVKVTFNGNYKGTKTLTFKINPVSTTVKSLTAGKKSLKVSITKKSTQVTGYQIQYATNKSFKSAKLKNVTSYKTTSATLKGLTAKKTYYVRVRTYKTVNGVKYYSVWSKIKYKKTK